MRVDGLSTTLQPAILLGGFLLSNKYTFINFLDLIVGDFCGRWTSCKFEEGTTSQLLVLESAMMGPMYQLLVGKCANGYPFSHIPTNK